MVVAIFVLLGLASAGLAILALPFGFAAVMACVILALISLGAAVIILYLQEIKREVLRQSELLRKLAPAHFSAPPLVQRAVVLERIPGIN